MPKAITYRNTVSDIDTIGMWDGKPLKIELPASELKRKDVTGCAVVLQETRSDNSAGTDAWRRHVQAEASRLLLDRAAIRGQTTHGCKLLKKAI